MSEITLSPPAEGTTVSVPLGQARVFTVSGTFQEDLDPGDSVTITVTVGGRSSEAIVELNQLCFHAAITLSCPSVVNVKATLHTKRLVVPGRNSHWITANTDSNAVRITVQDPSPDPLYLIVCRCVDSGGRPLPSLQVEAFDQDPGSPDDPLGTATITNVDGLAELRFYRSSFAAFPGERYPDVYFRISLRGRPLGYDLPGERNDNGVLRNFQPRNRPIMVHVPDVRGFVVQSPIRDKWLSLGGPTGWLGLPVTDEQTAPDDRGGFALFNHFEGGSIYWTSEWGAYEVHGLIRQKWADLGWERSFLGFPVSDELPQPGAAGGRYSLFEHGIVTWEPGQAEAVAGPHHYERLYSQLRAQILSRCFALGPQGRRNMFSETNVIQWPQGDPTAPADPEESERARWRILETFGENPFLKGSLLHIALAIEHNAGNEESGRALEAALATFESLFTWGEPGAETTARLPQRWDAGLPTDRASEAEQFLDGGHGAYSGSLPARNLHHYARRTPETLNRLLGPAAAKNYLAGLEDYYRYRVWELSMDELTGLVTTYWIIGTLAPSESIRNTVSRQASLLGNYLADNGYILVRPMGGLSFRGATGVLPALEHPFSRALMAVTGTDFTSRTDFRGAMTRAGYWPLLEGAIAAGQALGWTISAALLGLVPIAATTLGLGAAELEAVLAGQLLSPGTAGAALMVTGQLDAFDVSEPEEAAVALLFCDLPNKAGLYRALATTQAAFAPSKAWSVGFHPWIGLTGLLDADATVRETYAAWYRIRQAHPELEEDGIGSRLLFAASVAALLVDDAAHEARLVQRLEHAIVENYRTTYFDPKLVTWDDHGMLKEYCWNSPNGPIDLFAAIAVAFWHSGRRSTAGHPVTTSRFPQPLSAASFVHWPKAAVPVNCLSAFKGFRNRDGDLTTEGIPIEAIQGTRRPVRGPEGYELFKEPLVPRRPAPPPPAWAVADQLMCDISIPLHATEPGDLATGVTLFPGHDIQIQASGGIWWGGVFDPENGPEGLLGPVNDPAWPLHTGIDPAAQAHCLLGRLNGYFRIGPTLPRTKWVYHEERPLFLRLNHIAPGDGNGQFDVRIRVWGPAGFDPARVFHPVNVLRDGGVLRTSDPADLIEVAVTPGTGDAVEFQLVTPGNILGRKEIIIQESPTTGTGSWTIWTQEAKHTDANGLYLYQLVGATLTFRKDSWGMHTVQVLGGLDTALPGSQITFTWAHD